jgi:hypothetical protein
MELISAITAWGGEITSSIPVSTYPWLWEVLARNVTADAWKSATKNKIIASVHRIVDSSGSIALQQILSTGFKATSIPMATLEQSNVIEGGNVEYFEFNMIEVIPYMTEDTLTVMTVDELKKLCTKFNIKHGCKIAP